MWLFFAFLSAILLGFYDVFKKKSLAGNSVISVLLINALLSALIFLPFIFGSFFENPYFSQFGFGTKNEHILVALKAALVLSSWIFGYFAMKHLPLTLVGPFNATRPVFVLIGAMLIFSEKLNFYQWSGVILTIFSLFILSLSSKKEGIVFSKNRWVICLFLATILGAASGLYDKFLLKKIDPLFVQSWFNLYQALLMLIIFAIFKIFSPKSSDKFTFRYTILLIPIFLSLADFCYYRALAQPDALISLISMVRRSSVLISFLCGAILFHERNLRAKILDLALIALGMFLIYLGN